MADESPSLPLTHYKSSEQHQQEQQKLPIYINNNRNAKPPNKCFIYIFSAFVLLSVAALIFSLIVLRIDSPKLHLSSISLSQFSIANTTTANSTSQTLHLVSVAEFAVNNPNFGPFNFDNGTVGFMYGGAVVGERSTGGGRAEAKGTKTVNVTVEANLATNLSSNSGVLNLMGFANLRGRVRLIHVLRKRIWSEVACSVNIDLNTRQFQPDWVCE